MATKNKKNKTSETKPMSRSVVPMKDYDDSFMNAMSSFLTKKTGLQVEALSEHENIPYWIPTGCYSLNWIISNDFFKGLPGTKAILIAGESEKGKSLITDVFLGRNIEQGGASLKVDIEESAGYEFTSQIIGSEEVASRIRVISPKTIGGKEVQVEVDEDEEENSDDAPVGKKKGKATKTKKVITIETLTQVINNTVDFQETKGDAKNPSVVMVVDSVTQLTSDKEFGDIAANKDKRDMTSAQKIRGLFRAVTQRLRNANTTIIGIAHLTANIGVMFGPKFVVNAKGTGFAYASSLTLLMQDSKEMVDPKTGTPIGLKLRLKTHKNRCALKGRSAWMKFYFAKGIEPTGGLTDLLAQFGVFKASIQPSSKYTFEYDPKTVFTYKTESGEVLKFKEKDFPAIVEAQGGDIFLKELNTKLNDVYQNTMNNVNIDEGSDDEDEEIEDAEIEEEDDVVYDGDDGETEEFI